MTELVTFKHESRGEGRLPALGFGLSLALHAVLTCAILFWYSGGWTTQIVAAGPGEGGEGGGGAIEVGVADPSSILGFARPQSVAFLGDEDNPVNTARVETDRLEPDASAEVVPGTERDPVNPDAIRTNRPVAPQNERPFTGREERGGSGSSSAQVGRSYGSPTPAMSGGIGIGRGGAGTGTGLPGGSEYGRRIQTILSRNYAPPAIESDSIQYVVILLRIGRDGSIRSVVNGRVSPAFFRQRSPLAQVNYAAERAVIASNPLPPFPLDFLRGSDEAVAEVWFRYPK